MDQRCAREEIVLGVCWSLCLCLRHTNKFGGDGKKRMRGGVGGDRGSYCRLLCGATPSPSLSFPPLRCTSGWHSCWSKEQRREERDGREQRKCRGKSDRESAKWVEDGAVRAARLKSTTLSSQAHPGDAADLPISTPSSFSVGPIKHSVSHQIDERVSERNDALECRIGQCIKAGYHIPT